MSDYTQDQSKTREEALSHLEFSVDDADFNGRRMVRASWKGPQVYAARFDPYVTPHRVEFFQALLVRVPELSEAFWEPEGETDLTLLSNKLTATCDAADKPEVLQPLTVQQLIHEYPRLNEVVVDGLARRGETVNVISSPKVGKSWLNNHLGLCISTGRPFLDTFETTPGKVLIIDNELHPSVIAFRLWTVAQAMGIPAGDYENDLHVLPVRGKNLDLYGIETMLRGIEPGTYAAIILDAWYRSQPAGNSENDNAAVMRLYNLLDSITARMGCAFFCIHHSSKGDQGNKSVTDVGAGAGSQSRAADCHLILRPHEEAGCVVLEAAVRSFKPVAPVVLRWNFPLWKPDETLDASKVKGRLNAKEQKQNAADQEASEKIIAALGEPQTIRALRGKTGISKYRLERLLDSLESKGRIKWQEIEVRGNACRQYELIQELAHLTNGSAHDDGYLNF